jgi:hypothetical protein
MSPMYQKSAEMVRPVETAKTSHIRGLGTATETHGVRIEQPVIASHGRPVWKTTNCAAAATAEEPSPRRSG